VSTKRKNWSDAQKYCSSKGGYLAEVKSPEEEKLLEDHLMKSQNSYWIGLADLPAKDGRYIWQHSQTAVAWNDYAPGEPDSASEHCIGVSKYRGFWAWEDLNCSIHQIKGPILALCQF